MPKPKIFTEEELKLKKKIYMENYRKTYKRSEESLKRKLEWFRIRAKTPKFKYDVWRRHLKRHYNITPEIYENLYKEQKGLCKICNKTNKTNRRLDIDHCHITGKVRGLLCNICNKALGAFKDDINLFQKVIQYLEESKNAARSI